MNYPERVPQAGNLEYTNAGRTRGGICNIERHRTAHAGDFRIGDGEPIAYGFKLIDRYEKQLQRGFGVPEDSARANGDQLREELQEAVKDPKKDPMNVIARLVGITDALKEARHQNLHRDLNLRPAPVRSKPVVVFSRS